MLGSLHGIVHKWLQYGSLYSGSGFQRGPFIEILHNGSSNLCQLPYGRFRLVVRLVLDCHVFFRYYQASTGLRWIGRLLVLGTAWRFMSEKHVVPAKGCPGHHGAY